ncbi:3-phosphoshikimate 1-carboxyvinyltransferase [Mangrovimonas sp. YM274]|uniref:3-phosphoshikimate 1-carboxyvinyltransferase n=1 Tax=Mangrovimonas sp. YM274 TaxID=3070660 RepID=UPI0027DDF558|nr:3-phosphoshikimate 1-carboxyvinyltransferase [Mangrovimonas sp. YM274]WMI69587.1 3-phosphoshikimate 1-carboxyvinyltransferase [Mangrovimonas sp. YM274]
MNIQLRKSVVDQTSSVTITGSKSESNRLLLLQALFPEISIENLSESDDSKVMQKALESHSKIIDIHHAGTAMRFLTAYFATKESSEVVLTGSARMKERPIQVLVDALNTLGADITYLETEGCPPLKIKGQKLTKSKVSLKANVSSQYISALLLIAPKLENGLELTLEGTITSVPYIKMTLDLLNQIGVDTKFEGNLITVAPKTSPLNTTNLTVESDWSSASYFYSIVALSALGTEIKLSSYKEHSLQGDSVLAEIYSQFGVTTTYEENEIILRKESQNLELKQFNLVNAPDIAQTIAVTCLGLGIGCELTGLHTLKIKETDRLVALKNEMEKFGAEVEITNDSLKLFPVSNLKSNPAVATYNDHRMAMAFAPLALKTELQVEDAMVVSKSFPTFWEDLAAIGFQINQ